MFMAASSVLCLFSASSGGLAVYKFAFALASCYSLGTICRAFKRCSLQNINHMGEM
jgi:hypothetical protein